MLYEELKKLAASESVNVREESMPLTMAGLYGNNQIWINKHLSSNTEKACALAEELGHFYTTVGNILDQKKIVNIKQEKRARNWGYEKLVIITGFIHAFEHGVRNKFELAEFFGVTEEFIEESLKHYREKYGQFTIFENYIIFFDPLGIGRMFD